MQEKSGMFTVPKGRVEGFLLLRLFLDEEGVAKPTMGPLWR